mmetsp:Transcript_37580/g.84648  ORF Transcript_37580/g.84648 Transcript_37580/m.84648 type:complete len:138 (-) Transcript_37580:195-608(-)
MQGSWQLSWHGQQLSCIGSDPMVTSESDCSAQEAWVDASEAASSSAASVNLAFDQTGGHSGPYTGDEHEERPSEERPSPLQSAGADTHRARAPFGVAVVSMKVLRTKKKCTGAFDAAASVQTVLEAIEQELSCSSGD